jgi:hypothetical protein
MAETAVHYLLIGHVTKDLTPEGPRLGGTPSFAALTARALDYTPGIVTSAHTDVDLSPLAGLPLVRYPSRESTTFENLYSGGRRKQFLRGQAGRLSAAEVPLEWLRAPIVHLAPMAQEVDPALAGDFGGSFVGVTPQGWLREWGADGQVRNVAAAWVSAAEVLAQVNAVVTSLEDLNGDWPVAEAWARHARTLVVTRGAEGCTVFVAGEPPRDFPAPSVVEVEPTGAGDIFAAAYFINYYETGDPWASARFANHVAALSVTRLGLDGVPTRDEVSYCRARAAQG